MSSSASRPETRVNVVVRHGPSEEDKQRAAEQEAEEEARARAAEAARAQEAAAREAAFTRRLRILEAGIAGSLGECGYNPPQAPPLLELREARKFLVGALGASGDPAAPEAVKQTWEALQRRHGAALAFMDDVSNGVKKADLVSRAKRFLGRVDRAIDDAFVSVDIPDASEALQAKMRSFEHFIAEDWSKEPRRAIVAVHVDQENRRTIMQIGTAEHGPIYITIPRTLTEGEVANRTLAELAARLAPFAAAGDPMAVINGAHQGFNFTQFFRPSRVMRAPSGDLARLASNIAVVTERPRLAPTNTVVLNSAPYSLEEYRRLFPDDPRGTRWPTWADEAAAWDDTSSRTGFSAAPEPSREAFLHGLSHVENVIVIVAHCHGEQIFMTQPPPVGTTITGADIRARKAEIMANQPFVYLFCCNGGDTKGLESFAGVLLECGAAGVLASQTTLGGFDEREMFGRLLREERGAPPIEDIWESMGQQDYFEMELFLA